MPAWRGAPAVTSSCSAVHVRPGAWPRAGRSSTTTPSRPLSRAGRVPGGRVPALVFPQCSLRKSAGAPARSDERTLAQAGDLMPARPGSLWRRSSCGSRYRRRSIGLPTERGAGGWLSASASSSQRSLRSSFDQAHDHANPDRTPPKGLLFHASGPIDGGWGIIDFWESREDFDAFAPRVMEGMTAAGIQPQGPPDIKEFPVHEMIHA